MDTLWAEHQKEEVIFNTEVRPPGPPRLLDFGDFGGHSGLGFHNLHTHMLRNLIRELVKGLKKAKGPALD